MGWPCQYAVEVFQLQEASPGLLLRPQAPRRDSELRLSFRGFKVQLFGVIGHNHHKLQLEELPLALVSQLKRDGEDLGLELGFCPKDSPQRSRTSKSLELVNLPSFHEYALGPRAQRVCGDVLFSFWTDSEMLQLLKGLEIICRCVPARCHTYSRCEKPLE